MSNAVSFEIIEKQWDDFLVFLKENERACKVPAWQAKAQKELCSEAEKSIAEIQEELVKRYGDPVISLPTETTMRRARVFIANKVLSIENAKRLRIMAALEKMRSTSKALGPWIAFIARELEGLSQHCV